MHVLQMNCAQIEAFFTSGVPIFLNATAMIVTSIIVAFVYGWALTLVSLALTPVLILIILLMSYVYRKSDDAYEEALKRK